MRVLVIASLADSLLNFRGPLLAAMVGRGLEVHVAAPDLPEGSPLRQQLEERSLKVHDIPLRRTGMNPLTDVFTLWALRRLMLRIRVDVVLNYTIKPVIYGTLAAKLAGVPRRYALITGLGYAFTGQASGMRGKVKAVVQRLYRQAMRQAHKVFFQNPDDQTLFCQLGLLPTGTASVVVNGSGVDLANFCVAQLPQGEPRFLLVARLLGDKGVREYVEAARLVKQKYPLVQFDLVGWIDENPDAISQQELDSWINEGLVNYKGKLSDVRPAIASSSVYVLPSFREGTPRTVLEAMAMGRAVITTDAPGCRETVMDGVNGRLVPVRSVQKLADAMLELLSRPDLISQYGEQSRLIAEKKYDVQKVNDHMLTEMELMP